MSEEKGLNLTAKQLQELVTAAVTAAVAETKKPAPLTEQQIAEINQANEMRLQQRDLVLQGEANKKALQSACSHSRAENGSSTAVYVANGNYLICQVCQGKIRPYVPAEEQADPNSIYDTNLFNRMFQLAGSKATF
jgi:hypothetical protein